MEFIPTDDRELLESSTTEAINESTTFDEDQVMCDVTRKHVYENLSGKLVSDQESHADLTPNGGACFISDLFEGDIDDVRIFEESGIMRHLKPYDLVLADRGFTVRELLNPLQVELKIPAFLKGRKSLSAAEELETRRIAKARIHVERFNERLKQFKLVERKMPLSIAPLATQMVVVAGCLVNFQDLLCK
ncbi:uncharacterized protein [Montipora capricornis]|uniref:uncharacterized protein n=1 Tax=Montipora capricornis TaxID=246305 RepID=UPI0035F1A4D2